YPRSSPRPFARMCENLTDASRDVPTPWFCTSDIASASVSDVVLIPVKAMEAASEMVGASASVLNPVKTLPRTSEGTTLSSGNFPAPLLTESAIDEARFSDVLLNLVMALASVSDIADVSSLELRRDLMMT